MKLPEKLRATELRVTDADGTRTYPIAAQVQAGDEITVTLGHGAPKLTVYRRWSWAWILKRVRDRLSWGG